MYNTTALYKDPPPVYSLIVFTISMPTLCIYHNTTTNKAYHNVHVALLGSLLD